jgi:peptidoglycan/xylan/chitin deacetylase (PgdA/CDA1 family)
MYHAASPVSGRLRHLGVPADLLVAQLGRLRDEGFLLVGLSEALRLADAEPNADIVALTFDDGYVDFIEAAVPVLRAVDARATLYVPTAHVGRRAAWLGRAARELPRLLSWAQLRACVRSGRVEIGSHGHTHSHLDTLSSPALEREVAESRRVLESTLDIAVTSFCYPHGYHSGTVREAVRAAGYRSACEVGRRLRPARERWSVSRLAVGPTHDPARLVREIRRGGPLLVPSAKRALQPAWRQARRRSVTI